MVEAGPSEEKGPPRESRRGGGGGGGSPPFLGCEPKVPARHVIQLNGTSRFRHKPELVSGYGAVNEASAEPRSDPRWAPGSPRTAASCDRRSTPSFWNTRWRCASIVFGLRNSCC